MASSKFVSVQTPTRPISKMSTNRRIIQSLTFPTSLNGFLTKKQKCWWMRPFTVWQQEPESISYPIPANSTAFYLPVARNMLLSCLFLRLMDGLLGSSLQWRTSSTILARLKPKTNMKCPGSWRHQRGNLWTIGSRHLLLTLRRIRKFRAKSNLSSHSATWNWISPSTKTGNSWKAIYFNFLPHPLDYGPIFQWEMKQRNSRNISLVLKSNGTTETLAIRRLSLNKCNHRTILFVGDSSSGKTSLINSMANYVFDVKSNDPFRFQLIDQQESQKKVNVYDIYRADGFLVDPFPIWRLCNSTFTLRSFPFSATKSKKTSSSCWHLPTTKIPIYGTTSSMPRWCSTDPGGRRMQKIGTRSSRFTAPDGGKRIARRSVFCLQTKLQNRRRFPNKMWTVRSSWTRPWRDCWSSSISNRSDWTSWEERKTWLSTGKDTKGSRRNWRWWSQRNSCCPWTSTWPIATYVRWRATRTAEPEMAGKSIATSWTIRCRKIAAPAASANVRGTSTSARHFDGIALNWVEKPLRRRRFWKSTRLGKGRNWRLKIWLNLWRRTCLRNRIDWLDLSRPSWRRHPDIQNRSRPYRVFTTWGAFWRTWSTWKCSGCGTMAGTVRQFRWKDWRDFFIASRIWIKLDWIRNFLPVSISVFCSVVGNNTIPHHGIVYFEVFFSFCCCYIIQWTMSELSSFRFWN